MDFEIYPGFIVYKNGYGPVFIALHSGHAFGDVLGRDDNSDVISVKCWKKYGGTLILSTITRDRVYGIDYNRDIPPVETALEMYNKFINNRERDIKQFKKKYAFVARTKTEYNTKLRIYNTLWSYIRNTGNFLVFLHRHYARIKNYPSLIDVITFKDIGIKRSILQGIIEEVNKTHKKFFKGIENDFKRFLLMEEKRVMCINDKEAVSNDIKAIMPWCYEKIEGKKTLIIGKEKDFKDFLLNKETLNRITEKEVQKKMLEIFKKALKNAPSPRVTLEDIFSAEYAIAPMKQLLKSGNRIAVEIEINEFLSRFYPEKTVEIVLDIINRIREVDVYKKLGFTQTQILRFIKE